MKKARKPAAKKPARKPAAKKRASDSSDDSSDGDSSTPSPADPAARKSSNGVRRAAQKNQVPVREFDKENPPRPISFLSCAQASSHHGGAGTRLV